MSQPMPWFWNEIVLVLVLAYFGGIGLTWMLYEIKGWSGWLSVIAWPLIFAILTALMVVAHVLSFLEWIKDGAKSA